MKVVILHYVRLNSWSDIEYKNGAPVIKETVTELPLRFGFNSLNEPKKVLNINVSDVTEIRPFVEEVNVPCDWEVVS